MITVVGRRAVAGTAKGPAIAVDDRAFAELLGYS
jgi:hypothetical protein